MYLLRKSTIIWEHENFCVPLIWTSTRRTRESGRKFPCIVLLHIAKGTGNVCIPLNYMQEQLPHVNSHVPCGYIYVNFHVTCEYVQVWIHGYFHEPCDYYTFMEMSMYFVTTFK